MNVNEQQLISSFFNQDGYVLDYSNARFKQLGFDTIGIDLQFINGEYLSKGKALDAFILSDKYTNQDKIKILKALLYNYRYLYKEITSKEREERNLQEQEIQNIIEKYDRQSNLNFLISPLDHLVYFNHEYIERISKLMIDSIEDNPTVAIGKSKELLEASFKFILDESGEMYTENENIGSLRKKALNLLNLSTKDNLAARTDNNVKTVLAGLSQVVDGINHLRNSQGDGHGRGKEFITLPPRYARLVVGATIALVNFIWETYDYSKEKINDRS